MQEDLQKVADELLAELSGPRKPASLDLIQRMAKEHLGFWPHKSSVHHDEQRREFILRLCGASGDRIEESCVRDDATYAGLLSSFRELSRRARVVLDKFACPSCSGRGKRPGEIMWTEAECEDCNGHGFAGSKAPKVESVTPAQEEPKSDPWDALLPDGGKWVNTVSDTWIMIDGERKLWEICEAWVGENADTRFGAEAARLHAIVRARNGDWDAVLPAGSTWGINGKGDRFICSSKGRYWAVWKDGDTVYPGGPVDHDDAECLRKLVALRNEVDPPEPGNA